MTPEKHPAIIIVDDDAALLDVIENALTMDGYGCQTFTGAEAALQHLAGHSCDIIITDIVLHGQDMEGFELTRQVRRMRPDMNIIVMTGFTSDFSYDQAIKAGASDFIRKPLSLHELLVRIKHVMMQEKLREMSITDELTGLSNRRGFFAVAQQQLKVVNRSKEEFAILFADVDEFKPINDTWGHQKGDKALAAIADIFRRTFRESDLIARMGGDEFAVLLLKAPEKNFGIINERLQKSIDAYNAQDGEFKLSVSIGIAAYDYDKPCSIDELLRQADQRMYEQKQRKKNHRPSTVKPLSSGPGHH